MLRTIEKHIDRRSDGAFAQVVHSSKSAWLKGRLALGPLPRINYERLLRVERRIRVLAASWDAPQCFPLLNQYGMFAGMAEMSSPWE